MILLQQIDKRAYVDHRIYEHNHRFLKKGPIRKYGKPVRFARIIKKRAVEGIVEIPQHIFCNVFET